MLSFKLFKLFSSSSRSLPLLSLSLIRYLSLFLATSLLSTHTFIYDYTPKELEDVWTGESGSCGTELYKFGKLTNIKMHEKLLTSDVPPDFFSRDAFAAGILCIVLFKLLLLYKISNHNSSHSFFQFKDFHSL